MFDWIKDKITEPLQEMILEAINAYFISLLGALVDGVSTVLYKEMELVSKIFDQPYFATATTYAQGIAFSLLALRISYTAFQQYIFYQTGQESSPTQLLKDAAVAVAVIASVPWVVKTVFLFSMSIVDDLMRISPVQEISNLSTALMAVITPNLSAIFLILLLICGFVMVFIVLLQIAARAVMVGLLMVVGPFLWAFKNELGNVWIRAVFQACLTMPLQMFLLRGALGMLAAFASMEGFYFSVLLFLGFLWTTIKTPQFLQQWVSQTGVGGAVGGAASSAGQMVVMRRMMMKK